MLSVENCWYMPQVGRLAELTVPSDLFQDDPLVQIIAASAPCSEDTLAWRPSLTQFTRLGTQ